MDRLRHITAAAAVLLVAISLSSCGGGWFGGGTEPPNLSDALVEMPDALVPATDGSASVYARATDATATVIERVQGLFTPVRDNYNAIAYDAIEFTRGILDAIDTHIFGSETIMEYLQENGALVFEEDDAAGRTEITLSDDGTEYAVQSWVLVGDVWTKTLDVAFSQAGDRLSGTIVVRDEDSIDEARPIYQVDFDTANPGRGGAMTTELRAVNLAYGLLDNDITTDDFNRADKLWLLAYQADGEFHIAANVHYLDVKVEDASFGPYYMPVLNNGQNPSYTYGDQGVEGCYSYRGAFFDSETESHGALDLALVPANYAGTEPIFDAYSVGATYKQAITNWITADVAESAALRTNINTLLELLRTELAVTEPVDVTTSSDVDAVFAALEFIDENWEPADPSERDDLAEVLFVTQLTNPAYFDSSLEDSFVGTADLNAPEWAADVPTPALEVEVNQTDLPELTIEMPGAEEDPPEATF